MTTKFAENTVILESFAVDYVKAVDTNDGFDVVAVHATMDDDEEQVVTLPCNHYDSELEALTALTGKYIHKTIASSIELLIGQPLTWDTANNAVFLGDARGRYKATEDRYLSARELGMEAVDVYEVVLVEAVIETMALIKRLTK